MACTTNYETCPTKPLEDMCGVLQNKSVTMNSGPELFYELMARTKYNVLWYGRMDILYLPIN